MCKIRRKKASKDKWLMIRQLPVPINSQDYSGCYIDIVASFSGQLNAMQSHHRKILVIPFTISFMSGEHLDPEKFNLLRNTFSSGKNELLSDFIAAMRRALTKQQQSKKQATERKGKINKNQTRVAFTWVREQPSKADKQHYHLFLIVDRTKVQSTFWLSQKLMKIGRKFNLGLFYKRGTSHNLDREDISSYLNCIHHFSYLSKENTKDPSKRKLTANDYSSSRIKPPKDLRWQGFTTEKFKASLPISIDRYHYKEMLHQYPLCG
jgi:hypothetical protein